MTLFLNVACGVRCLFRLAGTSRPRQPAADWSRSQGVHDLADAADNLAVARKVAEALANSTQLAGVSASPSPRSRLRPHSPLVAVDIAYGQDLCRDNPDVAALDMCLLEQVVWQE